MKKLIINFVYLVILENIVIVILNSFNYNSYINVPLITFTVVKLAVFIGLAYYLYNKSEKQLDLKLKLMKDGNEDKVKGFNYENIFQKLIILFLLLVIIPVGIILMNEVRTIKIYDMKDIEKISNNLDGNYILMNDIDMEGYVSDKFDYIGCKINYIAFNGILDGNDKTLTNLSSPLFTCVGDEGYIGDLNVVDADIVSTSEYIGAVTRYSEGVLENIAVSGNVTSTRDNTGGVVGYASGDLINISFSGNVTGDELVGGIAGVMYGSNNKYLKVTGNIEGYSRVGGIGGNIFNNASYLYFEGSVTGINSVGGIASYSKGLYNVIVIADITSNDTAYGVARTESYEDVSFKGTVSAVNPNVIRLRDNDDWDSSQYIFNNIFIEADLVGENAEFIISDSDNEFDMTSVYIISTSTINGVLVTENVFEGTNDVLEIYKKASGLTSDNPEWGFVYN